MHPSRVPPCRPEPSQDGRLEQWTIGIITPRKRGDLVGTKSPTVAIAVILEKGEYPVVDNEWTATRPPGPLTILFDGVLGMRLRVSGEQINGVVNPQHVGASRAEKRPSLVPLLEENDVETHVTGVDDFDSRDPNVRERGRSGLYTSKKQCKVPPSS